LNAFHGFLECVLIFTGPTPKSSPVAGDLPAQAKAAAPRSVSSKVGLTLRVRLFRPQISPIYTDYNSRGLCRGPRFDKRGYRAGDRPPGLEKILTKGNEDYEAKSPAAKPHEKRSSQPFFVGGAFQPREPHPTEPQG
jgi:hypothetical protein